tara:strand:+ start:25 stop:495 length:471 start_codon:yes stop_codon:yes gene_type:complete
MVSKSGKLVTFRGTFTPSTSGNYSAERIMLEDGDNTTAYRLYEVYCWSVDSGSTADGCMIVSTMEAGITDYTVGRQNAADNRQIAWSAWSNTGSSGDRNITQALVDPDNIINEDLWLGAFNSSSGSDDVNYLIIAEKIRINLNENLFTSVRNRSQA